MSERDLLPRRITFGVLSCIGLFGIWLTYKMTQEVELMWCWMPLQIFITAACIAGTFVSYTPGWDDNKTLEDR